MKTTVTVTWAAPVGIPIRELPAGTYAFVVGPAGNGFKGELVYRPADHRSCQIVRRPGDMVSDTTGWIVRPITEPTSVTFGPTGDGSVDVPVTEPATIPMNDMKPGSVGVVTACIGNSGTLFVGDGVICGIDSDVISMGGIPLNKKRFTVRILQPDDKLTIEVVDEPTDDPDDDFERLADGTRLECRNCSDSQTAARTPPCDTCLPTDTRGHGGLAHPCWRPIEPTLDDALRTGTAEEIVAALGDPPGCDARGWYELWDDLCVSVHGLYGDTLIEVCRRLHDRTVSAQTDIRDLAAIVVELRDRLDLFGETENE